jgi:hypothetical protein
MITLTTGACAALLNQALEMDALDADFIRGEVDDGRLIARVDVKAEAGRDRRYLRIHPEDYTTYVQRYWGAYLPAIQAMVEKARAA